MKKPATTSKTFLFESYPEFDNHESVTFIHDESSGMRGFIAIHNTNIGSAVGGTRFWYYPNEEEALRDVLRLSRAMTYKCALAGVPYGGGKAVLMAPEPVSKLNDAYLAAYAERLNTFDCPFHTGEDVGLSEENVRVLAKRAPSCIIGRPEVGGLPSRWAALSVFCAMKAAMQESFGSESFERKTVAIKGLGNVGSELCRLVSEAGASVIAAEVNAERVRATKKAFPKIKIVPHLEIATTHADIYAPCAMGNEFDEASVPKLSCSIICGAANNQLASPQVGALLHGRGILYVPDYVANAGGLINVVDELHPGGYSRERVETSVGRIRDTVHDIIVQSRTLGLPTSDVADSIARKRFAVKKKVV
ncbi:hypothetical protein A2853_02430 [Candidatus Kaiserbacteria bacterium RIFCSPHIGHO2_01_FULL_55_17]|uniref:Glutamate/phenylalanine/leucine/valine/L-tryptophan dehydrogenase C-terminal domain-containing protein n=1 Tax=Candidatus Kaiserbacteria bacterium RIFCSPHIGHO2_01_FULL_55_17 TaxID=1798484 RepID=A0A1F6D8L8_9BACT|nr:MAG: hypothetical protein A2853_02430 [Candidatus Kaiserbacteria bacterium RIFCSPHIGHO2_01_FULL_55_17]